MARRVKRIQAAGIAHRRTQSQGLATGAGAEVGHHFAALGIHQQGQQLTAFVLHFDAALGEELELVQRRLARHAQAPGRIGCGLRRYALH